MTWGGARLPWWPMKISEQIPFTPMALVTDFLQQPSERPGVVEVDGKPSVTMQPNTGYWVSGMAMERAGRIMREKDAALEKARKGQRCH